MDAQQLWKRYAKHLTFYPEVGMSLDISRIRFDDAFLSRMAAPMQNAFQQMKALEGGAIANPDEHRMVGHYWLRSPEYAPTPDLKNAITSTLTDIKEFAAAVHRGSIKPQKASRFKNILIVGIGGSALGPQLVNDALASTKDPMRMYFCDNTDPDGISRLLKNLETELVETLVVVISKSGGTPETRNGAVEVAAQFEKEGLKFAKHAVAVTCEGSKLDNQAKSEGWLKRFPMWDWVGGRTSLFSAVGLVGMALQGVDIDQFIEGGREMDQITRSTDAMQNPAALLALMWHFVGEGRGKKDMVILPYKDRLALMSKYLQQLVMESLGKEKDLKGQTVNQGIAVYGNKGSTDQHAYVQQLREGVNNFFATFIEVLSDYTPELQPAKYIEVEAGVTCGDFLSGFLQGTRRALYENQRDSITITFDMLSTRTIGALIALYERAVGLYASLVNVNAYHQPGVEAGKKAAAQVIDIQRKIFGALNATPRTAAELAEAIQAPDDVETAYKILEHLATNPGRGVIRHGSRKPLEAKYSIG